MEIKLVVGKKFAFLSVILVLAGIGSATISFNDSDPVDFLTDIDMNGNKISDLGNPSDSDDAATKNYVDSQVGGSLGWPSNFVVHSQSRTDTANNVLSISGSAGRLLGGVIYVDNYNKQPVEITVDGDSKTLYTTGTSNQDEHALVLPVLSFENSLEIRYNGCLGCYRSWKVYTMKK